MVQKEESCYRGLRLQPSALRPSCYDRGYSADFAQVLGPRCLMAPHAAVDRQQWAVKEKYEQLFFSEWHSAVGLLIRVHDICKKYTNWIRTSRTYIFPSIH